MANELHAHTTSGLTLYAVVLNSIGQLWNGSAFEAYDAPSWTDYDIALTEVGAGVYLGSMPAAVAGAYSYAVYEKAGANPATTDTLRGTGYLEWGGSAVVAQTGDAYAVVAHTDYGNSKLVRSTTPANTLDVSATGEAGLDFANIKDATGAHTLTNITVPAVTTVGSVTGAVGSVTGAVGSVTGAVGSVTGAVGSIAAGGIAAASFAAGAIDAAAIATDAIDADALAADAVAEIGALTPAVAISATTAASVSTGALAVRTHHTLSQAITSTYAGNLNAATKLWLAVKSEKDDTDAQSVVFIEKTAGLTVLAGAAYTTVANGSLTVGGSAGAWTITVALDEAVTALLTAYADGMLWAECKALIAGSTASLWDGVCDVTHGIVQAIV